MLVLASPGQASPVTKASRLSLLECSLLPVCDALQDKPDPHDTQAKLSEPDEASLNIIRSTSRVRAYTRPPEYKKIYIPTSYAPIIGDANESSLAQALDDVRERVRVTSWLFPCYRGGVSLGPAAETGS